MRDLPLGVMIKPLHDDADVYLSPVWVGGGRKREGYEALMDTLWQRCAIPAGIGASHGLWILAGTGSELSMHV